MGKRLSELQAAAMVRLRQDPRVAGTFPSGSARVYDLPPQNAPFPYVSFGDAHDQPHGWQGFDSGDVGLNVHVFSRTSPPGYAEAFAIADAVLASLTEPGALALPSNDVADVLPVEIKTLPLGPDGQTAHVIVIVQVALDAA